MSSTQILNGLQAAIPTTSAFVPFSSLSKSLSKGKKDRNSGSDLYTPHHIPHSTTLTNMADTLSSAMAFPTNDYYNPQATISLSDTSLQNSLMTPEPTSPESSYNVKEESVECDESQRPTKKRKSWGQELPTPKTNLPPR